MTGLIILVATFVVMLIVGWVMISRDDSTKQAGANWSLAGRLFLVASVGLMIWGLAFDTSVSTTVGPVQNVGLLQNRMIMFTGAFAFVIAGILCLATGALINGHRRDGE